MKGIMTCPECGMDYPYHQKRCQTTNGPIATPSRHVGGAREVAGKLAVQIVCGRWTEKKPETTEQRIAEVVEEILPALTAHGDTSHANGFREGIDAAAKCVRAKKLLSLHEDIPAPDPIWQDILADEIIALSPAAEPGMVPRTEGGKVSCSNCGQLLIEVKSPEGMVPPDGWRVLFLRGPLKRKKGQYHLCLRGPCNHEARGWGFTPDIALADAISKIQEQK